MLRFRLAIGMTKTNLLAKISSSESSESTFVWCIHATKLQYGTCIHCNFLARWSCATKLRNKLSCVTTLLFPVHTTRPNATRQNSCGVGSGGVNWALYASLNGPYITVTIGLTVTINEVGYTIGLYYQAWNSNSLIKNNYKWACLPVFVFVCFYAYLWNHTSELRQIFCACYLWMWLSPPLAAWQRCDMLCFVFCGWRYVST